MKIVQKVASTTVSKDDPTCNAINQNDYINDIYLYNAGSYKKSNNYDVNGIKADGTIVLLGLATYDMDTDRIIFNKDDKMNICMSSYPQIVFTASK